MPVAVSLNQRRWFLFIGDILFILAATKLSQWIRFGRYYDIFGTFTGASFFTITFYLFMLYVFDLYNLNRCALSRDTLFRGSLAVCSAGLLSIFVFYTLPYWQYGRGMFLIQMGFAWVFIIGLRFFCFLVFVRGGEKESVLVIGAGRAGRLLMDVLSKQGIPYRIRGYLDDDPGKKGMALGPVKVLGTTSELETWTRLYGVKTLILAVTHNLSMALIGTMGEARIQGMNVLTMPQVYEDVTGSVPVEHLPHAWLVYEQGFLLISKQYIQRIKRVLDVLVSGLLLLLFSPFFLLTAAAIRLDSEGPVFFTQERVGKNGQTFILWKFRSMRTDAEANGPVWASEKDPRITRVGKVIRKLRIDELPQVFNVFRGDMSLIGPRPERPAFVAMLEEKLPHYMLRHAVRPGITGWAQVKYPYGATVEDALKKLEYDVYYIKNMSLFLDLKILLKTISIVLFGQGAR